jgi:hypothetical protein
VQRAIAAPLSENETVPPKLVILDGIGIVAVKTTVPFTVAVVGLDMSEIAEVAAFTFCGKLFELDVKLGFVPSL